MIDKNAAAELVRNRLKDKAPSHDPWLVVEDATIERSFGWIFFYNSSTFLETGNFLYQLAGNGPVFVNKFTGAITFYGAIPPLEEIIRKYEADLNG